MKNLSILLLTWLTIHFYACNYSKINKELLNKDSIIDAHLTKAGCFIDDKYTPCRKQLNTTQIQDISSIWNNAIDIGPVKSITQYFINFTVTDSSKHTIKINEKYWKLDNDIAYLIPETSLLINYWEQLNKPYLDSLNLVFKSYVHWQESVDSDSAKSLVNRCLDNIGYSQNIELLTVVLNFWMYYDPTDFDTRKYTFQVLKNSRPHSIEAINNRLAKKLNWEDVNCAPYSELENLRHALQSNI